MELVVVGAATYTFVSRVVTMFVLDTSIPRLFPPPFEYTLTVEPLIELKLKLADPSVPVPLYSIPVTTDVPPEEAVELFTEITQVRILALAEVVPPNTTPFNV